ncbi:hypothetical protein H8356DRAFT_1416224 [Neocallimastix lanati (nom. inval.)]|nr:hypothetical protein H8356DRAFT_1416224 [Neocallimastix sp. JGI-2020a]
MATSFLSCYPSYFHDFGFDSDIPIHYETTQKSILVLVISLLTLFNPFTNRKIYKGWYKMNKDSTGIDRKECGDGGNTHSSSLISSRIR